MSEVKFSQVPYGAQYRILEQVFKTINGKPVRVIKKVKLMHISLNGELAKNRKMGVEK